MLHLSLQVEGRTEQEVASPETFGERGNLGREKSFFADYKIRRRIGSKTLEQPRRV